MKFGKQVSVELVGDAKEAYSALNALIGKQRTDGRTNSDEIKLWNGIQRAFDLVANNPFYGENAKKDQIPSYYRIKHNAENLFIEKFEKPSIESNFSKRTLTNIWVIQSPP